MIKVSDVIADIIQEDELALEALRAGILNYTAYAEKIHSRVEKVTFKEVKIGTIVVALSRIAKDLPETSAHKPEIIITNISVKTSLMMYVFEKTLDVQRRIATLNPFLIPSSELFSVTEGHAEVSLVITDKATSFISDHFNQDPEKIITDLAAVTIQFSPDYVTTPNFFYTLFAVLAGKRINIVETVSTYTELSFIVEKKDMEETVRLLNTFFTQEAK